MLKSACVNGVTIALLNSGLSFFFVPVAVSLSINANGAIILDPVEPYEQGVVASVVTVFAKRFFEKDEEHNSKNRKIVFFGSNGTIGEEKQMDEALKRAGDAGDYVFGFIKESVQKRVEWLK